VETDDLTFFHQATVRICGSLDTDVALSDCFAYLKSFMPLNGLALNMYEPEVGGLRCIAMVSDIAVKAWDSLLSLPAEARREIERERETVTIQRDAEHGAVGRHVFAAMGLSEVSAVILRLILDEEKLGVVVAFAQGQKRYHQEHARLLALVHDPFAIAMSNTLRYREILDLQDLLKEDNRYLQKELHRISGDEIVGENFGLRDVMEMVHQVAPLESQVLLLGETGVGKEVIANAIHYSSPRRHGPFLKVNCGAIPDTLLDSELFGHEKGAFTGATNRKRGLFESSDKGTIFLDEIGELPTAAQVRLLRVLQTKEIVRVGGSESVKVDVRIIAATHRDLSDMVRSGEFREDLWYRLNVFPITIPPLRHRKMDIPALVNHFIERKSQEMNLRRRPVLSSGALFRLQGYHWPGNVRELENAVERELILCHGMQLNEPHIFGEFGPFEPDVTEAPIVHQYDERVGLDEVIRTHIMRALKIAGGRVQGANGAAALLGVNPSTLRNRMKRMNISYGRKRFSHG
jgi:transcriptional regulator with GAF, ATPase, and Fis domain